MAKFEWDSGWTGGPRGRSGHGSHGGPWGGPRHGGPPPWVAGLLGLAQGAGSRGTEGEAR